LTDHAQLPRELQQEVIALVRQTTERSGWPASRTLKVLAVSRSSYQRWRAADPEVPARPRSSPGPLFEALPSERRAIVAYALQHPEVRHRELAWKMLDEGVCAVSSATVYRVLREANLVCRWNRPSKEKGPGREASPTRPDERWQTDIKYVPGEHGRYYLLSFLDVYSRYIVHHRLLRGMDGQTVSTEAAAALETLAPDARPADYYRGNPEALLAERRRKLQAARELRKQENLKLRQRRIPWPGPREPSLVSTGGMSH